MIKSFNLFTVFGFGQKTPPKEVVFHGLLLLMPSPLRCGGKRKGHPCMCWGRRKQTMSASGCYIGGPIYVNPGILALVYGMTLRSLKCHNHNLEHDVSNVNVQLIQIILPSTNQQTWWSPWLPITRQGPKSPIYDLHAKHSQNRFWLGH